MPKQLTDVTISTTVAATKPNKTLKELFLADNHLNQSDAIQLCQLLKWNNTLTLLDIRNNNIQVT